MIEKQFDLQLEDDEDYVESAALDLNHIRALNQVNSDPAQPYFVDLELDGKSLTMEVDTEACMTLVSQETYSNKIEETISNSPDDIFWAIYHHGRRS